jgi:hypothetical protein
MRPLRVECAAFKGGLFSIWSWRDDIAASKMVDAPGLAFPFFPDVIIHFAGCPPTISARMKNVRRRYQKAVVPRSRRATPLHRTRFNLKTTQHVN